MSVIKMVNNIKELEIPKSLPNRKFVKVLILIFVSLFFSGCSLSNLFQPLEPVDEIVEISPPKDLILVLNNSGVEDNLTIFENEINFSNDFFNKNLSFKFNFGSKDNLVVNLNEDLIFNSNFSHKNFRWQYEYEEVLGEFGTFEILSFDFSGDILLENNLSVEFTEVDDGVVLGIDVFVEGEENPVFFWTAPLDSDTYDFNLNFD